MAGMALATKLRAAIITGTRWEQVDLERRMAWVRPDQAKARRAVPVPLDSEAIAFLQNQIGKHRDRVFTLSEVSPWWRKHQGLVQRIQTSG